MKALTAYVLDGLELRIRPAPVERQWMDESEQRFVYRCLPLNIANSYGWEILCTAGFKAVWDGRKGKDSISITSISRHAPSAVSHFGNGVLTFHVPCLFRTDSGVDLYVTGPVNRPKDGVAPLSGIIETDWSPYTFTMNWLFTRPFHEIRFEADEPFCHIFPLRRGEVEEFQPTVRKLSENPDLEREYKQWSESRTAFNTDLNMPGSKAVQEQWQKTYFRGATPSGQMGTGDHRNRLRVRPFKAEK